MKSIVFKESERQSGKNQCGNAEKQCKMLQDFKVRFSDTPIHSQCFEFGQI